LSASPAGGSSTAAAAAFAGLPLLAGVPFPTGLPFAGDALPLLAFAGVLAGEAAALLACWPIAGGLDMPAALAAAAAVGNSKLPLRRKTVIGAVTGWGGGCGTNLQRHSNKFNRTSAGKSCY
jgi:hypothetical protein